jgi:hypothetical protein
VADIAELPGHHVEDRALDCISTFLSCQCGWKYVSQVEDIDEHKQLHWAAKIIESDTLAELHDEVVAAIAQLDQTEGFPLEWLDEVTDDPSPS